MPSGTSGVGLRDEAGSSSANSRVKRAAVSSSSPEYFGNEENHEARGLAARRPKAVPSASGGRCRQAPPGAVSAGSNNRNSASGGGSRRRGSGTSPPAAAASASVTPTAVNSKRAVFAGGRKAPDGKPRRSSSKTSLAEASSVSPAAGGGGSRTVRPRPRPRRQPPPPPSHSPRSRLEGSNKMSAAARWGKSGSSGGAAAAVGDGGTSFSRAASRVALRAAQAKGLAVALPAALCVPSRLMDSTAASRAGVYTPPSVGKAGSASAMPAAVVAAAGATPPRFTTPRRRRSLGGGGVVAEVSGGSSAAATPIGATTGAGSAVAAESPSDAARELVESYDTTSSNGGGGGSSGRKRELQERTGLVHVSDKVPPHSASGNNSFVPTVSSAVGVPKRGRSGGAALVLLPPTRCHDKLSTELEAKAMRRSIGRGSNSSISSIHSAGGVSPGGGGDEGRLWKPSSSFSGGSPEKSLDEPAEGGVQGTRGVEESLSAGGSAASFLSAEALYLRGGAENAMVSSLDSSWSMASVDETARQPNARESHASGGDPVARMLLCQSDDYDYGLGFADSTSRGSSNSSGSGDRNVSGGGGGGSGMDFGPPPSLVTFVREQDGSSSSFSSSSSLSSSSMAGTSATGGGFSSPGPKNTPSLQVINPAGAALAAVAAGEGGGRGGGAGGRSSPTLFAAGAAGGAAVKVSWVKRAEGGRGFGECRGGGVFSSVRREGFGDAKGSENCLFRPFAFHRPS